MRCPKCGYISFDHVETCLKCKKDISGTVDVNGTTYHVAAPSFLKFMPDDLSEEDGGFGGSDSEHAAHNTEFSDSDLEVLVGDDDFDSEEGDISFDSFGSDDVAAEFQLETDEAFELEEENDDGFEFELEDDDDQSKVPLDTADFDVPDELSDISDLAPPAKGSKQAPAGSGAVNLSLDDDMSPGDDLDLAGMDFDLGIGNSDSGLSLSLDDIDISEDGLSSSGSDDFDGLSMDMDLDGLDDDDSKSKVEKSTGGLDDINLSLD
jgi:hypothetical protein